MSLTSIWSVFSKVGCPSKLVIRKSKFARTAALKNVVKFHFSLRRAIQEDAELNVVLQSHFV